MQFLSNLHTHSVYCDGKSTIEETIKKAIEYGFVSIGFSGHSHMPFKDEAAMTLDSTIEYINEIKKLKEKYKDKIEVYLGIEADYYSHIDKVKAKEMGLDYTIGSVHCIKDKTEYFSVDQSKESFENMIKHFNDVKTVIKNYYNNVKDMILRDSPNIIGHIDLPRKFNKDSMFFNENETWYTDIVENALSVVKESGIIVEVNTNKITKENPNLHYPSVYTLKRVLEKNIPITLSADAHAAERINYRFDEMTEVLKNMGFKYVKIMKGGSFKDIEI